VGPSAVALLSWKPSTLTINQVLRTGSPLVPLFWGDDIHVTLHSPLRGVICVMPHRIKAEYQKRSCPLLVPCALSRILVFLLTQKSVTLWSPGPFALLYSLTPAEPNDQVGGSPLPHDSALLPGCFHTAQPFQNPLQRPFTSSPVQISQC
jgi:hypothetical protein